MFWVIGTRSTVDSTETDNLLFIPTKRGAKMAAPTQLAGHFFKKTYKINGVKKNGKEKNKKENKEKNGV